MGFQLLRDHLELAENLSKGCTYDKDDVIDLGAYLWSRLDATVTPTTGVAKAAAKFDRLVGGEDFAGDRDALRARVKTDLARPRY